MSAIPVHLSSQGHARNFSTYALGVNARLCGGVPAEMLMPRAIVPSSESVTLLMGMERGTTGGAVLSHVCARLRGMEERRARASRAW